MRQRILLPLCAAALLGGCVTAAKYKAQEAETESQKSRADALDAKSAQLAKDLDAAKKNSDDLAAKVKAGADQLAGLQVSNKDLQDSLAADKSALSKKAAELIKDRDGLQQKLDASAAQAAALQRQLSDAEGAKKALEDAKAAELAKAQKSYDDMAASLKGEIAAGQVQISQLKGKLTLDMVDRILFDSGRAEIKDDGRKVLDKVGAALNQIADKDVRIEGHTDDKPIAGDLRGKYATNWELSTARATAVVRYLIDHASVDPKRLVAAGYGEFRPKADNATPEGRALNRRIEIILVPRD